MKRISVFLVFTLVWFCCGLGFAQNNALDFDGVDGYVAIADHNDLDLTDDFTIEFWFKADVLTGNQDYIISKATNHYCVIWEYTDNTLEFYSTNYTGADNPLTGSQILINDTNWHHIAYSYDGGTDTWAGYKDGVQVFSITSSFTINAGTGLLYLGAANGGIAYADCHLDEVRFWDVGRTKAQIRENMFTTLTGAEANLVAYYQFNESSGTSLPDFTGNGHDGTLINMGAASWVTSTFPLDAGTTVNSSVDNAAPATVGNLGFASHSNFDASTDLYVHEIPADPHNPPSYTYVQQNKYWVIDAYEGAGSPVTATVTLNGVDSAGANTFLVKRDNGQDQTGDWTVTGTYDSHTASSITFTGVELGSQFTLGSDSDPLPVVLFSLSVD